MNSYDIFVISLDVHIFLCLCLNRSYHCDRFCGIVASSPLIFLSHFLHLLKPCRSRVVRGRHVWNASLQFMSLGFLKTERRNLENLRSNFSCDVTDVLGDGQVKEAIGCTSWDIWRIFLRWYRHHHQWWSKWDHPAPGEKDAISRHFNDSRTWKILKESKRETKSMKEDEREAHQRYQQKSKHLAKNDQTSVVTQQLLLYRS